MRSALLLITGPTLETSTIHPAFREWLYQYKDRPAFSET